MPRIGGALPERCDVAQDTHVLVKPDGLARGLAPTVVHGLRRDGLLVETVGVLRLSAADAERWYPEKRDEPDGGLTLAYLCEGPVLLLAVRGPDAIRRALSTKRRLRAALTRDERRNVVHCPETLGERDHERTVFAPLLL
ncbi:nucleoside-diphosphate kinase [Streptomyces sp. Ru62]|uniref:nucleoside-diphosphate kinase n=1 Tax=Streptomyces sp. Ru62 TaxID=2080745 RepID=UPI0010E57C51|nr:nucleoside-diphosphate kinase [Streptomyces sp. Ru62]